MLSAQAMRRGRSEKVAEQSPDGERPAPRRDEQTSGELHLAAALQLRAKARREVGDVDPGRWCQRGGGDPADDAEVEAGPSPRGSERRGNLGAQPARGAPLEKHLCPLQTRPGLVEQSTHEPAGGGERRVRHDLEAPTGPGEGKEVAFHDGDAGEVLEAPVQPRREAGVTLHGHDAGAGAGEASCERPCAGPEVEHELAPLKPGGTDQAIGDSAVTQEVGSGAVARRRPGSSHGHGR